jgi:hypothetical protein
MVEWVDSITRDADGDGDLDLDADVGQPVRDYDPDAESLVDEFVDLFNARDVDGLGELLWSDVDAEFVHEHGSAGALEGLEDLFVRQPYSILTRGEVGNEPIAAVWRPGDEGGYMQCGFLVFEFSDGDEPLVSRVEYVEEIDSDDILIEEPDDVDEGVDWELADQA